MSRREATLLALAAIGFLVPNAMVALFIAEHGLDPGAFLDAVTDTLPVAQLAADLGIAFVAFAFWAAWEGRRLKMRSWWVPIPASLLAASASRCRSSSSCGSAGSPPWRRR